MKRSCLALCMFISCISSLAIAQSPRILDRLPFEVAMDIRWQGQDIQIRKVLACNLTRRMTSSGVRAVWDQSADRFYYVLPSKEVLIVRLPGVCASESKKVIPPSSGYLPIIYWVDNLDSPKEAEEIIWHRYFTDNSQRRFEVTSFRVFEAPQSTHKIENDQRLVWLIDSRFHNFDSIFIGLSVIVIPKLLWEKYPKLSAELSKYTSTRLVDRSLIRSTAIALLSNCLGPRYGIGPTDQCLENQSDFRPYFLAMVRIGDVWRIREGDIGVRRLFKYVDAKKIDQSSCPFANPLCNLDKSTYSFMLDTQLHERRFSEPAGIFFDVNTQTLQFLIFSKQSSSINVGGNQ